MIQLLLSAALAGSIAGLVTHLFVPVMIEVAGPLEALGRRRDRRRELEPVPRLGGVAITAGLALGACGVAMIEWNRWGIDVGRSELVALAIGTLMVFLVGVVDDVLGVSVTKKFLFQVAAAYLLVHLGWSFQVLSLPGIGNVHLGALGPVVSLLWIVGVTNAINLLDGLDGLAGGVAAVIALGLLGYALLQGEALTVVLMAAMAGACLGFLLHNWAPARIFMGDSGSLTLGFLLAVMSVHSSLKAPATVAILVPILALGLPVIDTLLVMVVRFLDQPHGRLGDRFLRMFHADRNHLHHALERFVANRRRIVGAIYGAALAFCAMALVVAVTHNATLGLVLVAVEVAAVLILRNLGKVIRAGGRAVRAGGRVVAAGNGAWRRGQEAASALPAVRGRRRHQG